MGQLEDRFSRKLAVDQTTGCWLWQGSIDRYGYGRVKVAGRNRQAHLVVYELLEQPVPAGMTLDHLKADRGPCRHRHCCNPDHLEIVSRGENARRANRDRARKG